MLSASTFGSAKSQYVAFTVPFLKTSCFCVRVGSIPSYAVTSSRSKSLWSSPVIKNFTPIFGIIK